MLVPRKPSQDSMHPVATGIAFEFNDDYLELLRLLVEAAGLEHSLMTSYLFGMFSLKPEYAAVAGELTSRSYIQNSSHGLRGTRAAEAPRHVAGDRHRGDAAPRPGEQVHGGHRRRAARGAACLSALKRPLPLLDRAAADRPLQRRHLLLAGGQQRLALIASRSGACARVRDPDPRGARGALERPPELPWALDRHRERQPHRQHLSHDPAPAAGGRRPCPALHRLRIPLGGMGAAHALGDGTGRDRPLSLLPQPVHGRGLRRAPCMVARRCH